jgi:carnitine O-palmitoyltransferase 2
MPISSHVKGIRSATTATREAVLAFKLGIPPGKLLEHVKNCSDVHSTLVKQCSLGQGFDRHLFGLNYTAKRLGRPQNALFTHPVYKRMGHFVLSTSTLSTDTIYFGGFGPVVPDGFGVGYNVTDQKLGAAITAYKVVVCVYGVGKPIAIF